MVGKGSHTLAVMEGGLDITGIWGEHRARDIRAATSVEDALGGGFQPEWALLCVKSYDTVQALRDLEPALEGLRGVISLQNGLGNVEAIDAAAPRLAVGGRVIFGATTPRPGHVEVTVCADDVLLGPAGGPGGVEGVVDAISSCGIPCRFEERIASFIWDKVLYNVCLNALATLLGTDYGSIGDNPDTWAVIRRLVAEFYEVSAAEGVELVSADSDSYLSRLKEELLPPTRGHRSSMQEDILNGRRTEIAALNGGVWRLARKHGIQVPANEMLTRMVRFLEGGAGRHPAPVPTE